ncbi:hypothetical protein CYMTET_39558 [Cymbomonas tetramitiformis]|uniref:Uncharacterized protein n=1 Tax=Cymbomonas tetramitiformis TaxID=36881 RepID=A0AAE0C9W4_9CHLO|nr:hypothetical protein CYMTET_39558 [Cymbomonas tetramitiformis]
MPLLAGGHVISVCVACSFSNLPSCFCTSGYIDLASQAGVQCVLPPPPPLFDGDFTCGFACAGESGCPCSKQECSGSRTSIVFSNTYDSPPCLEKSLDYCNTDSRGASDTGCTEFLRREVVSSIASSGSESTMQVAGSGFTSGNTGQARHNKLTVNAAALSSGSVTLGMSRMTDSEVQGITLSSQAYTGTKLGDMVALTPHGQTFDAAIALELPFNATGPPGIVRAANLSASEWEPFTGTVTYEVSTSCPT